MRRDTLIQAIALGVLAVALSASALLAMELTASSGRHRLTYVVRAEENDPPQVALGISMGAFRGILVNYLWIRAHTLKEAGKYHEAIDLASMITKLQPRFPAVWSFHAWNMAYNISVTTQTRGERWQWVNAGINLLRREGVVHNPNDLLVHKELGWIFLHKIGGYMDDANLYYKRQLALEWTEVLGPPPPPRPRETRQQAIEKYAAWLQPIADAPASWSGLVERVPGVAPLAAALRDRARIDLGEELQTEHGRRRFLGAVQVHAAVARSGLGRLVTRSFGGRDRAFAELLADPAHAPAWDALLAHLRRRVLVEDYNMEPHRMIRYTRKYGPLDWRHYGAHGVYWIARGVEGALTRVNEENARDFDFLNTERVLIHSIQELYRSGDLYFDYAGAITNPSNPNPLYAALPNPHYVESYQLVMEELRARGGIFESARRAWSSSAAGYENFMKDAIRFLYRRGQKELAARMRDELYEWPYANWNDPEGRRAHFSSPMDEFIQNELADDLTRPNVARDEIVAALQGAFFSGLLGDDEELFRDQIAYASLVYRIFTAAQHRRTIIDPNEARMAQFPPFDFLAGTVFANFIALLERDDAELAYGNAPEDLRRYGYDIIRQHYADLLAEEAKAGGRPFEEVFPEPPGMDQHRRRVEELQRRNADRQLDIQAK